MPLVIKTGNRIIGRIGHKTRAGYPWQTKTDKDTAPTLELAVAMVVHHARDEKTLTETGQYTVQKQPKKKK
jgi:hypothetical protein